MFLYSTNNKSKLVSLKDAVLKGLPEDNGLYMPSDIPSLSENFIKNLGNLSFPEISLFIAKTLIGNSIPNNEIESIISDSISFPAPLISLNENINILELFHGPSLAFKDFGARFMAQLMSYYNRNEDKELVILVATSGDTGGAVAAGFYNVPGIKVIILYPSGKVSKLQELQLTTFGSNIYSIEVEGNFDDCQKMVKQSFLDDTLKKSFRLTSANSINIARLIPQSFYYFEGFKRIGISKNVVFSVPSGNFGNLTAGLISKKMGLPIEKFIAATNVNNIVPKYLSTGKFVPKNSIQTISNAMDVGNPSNFSRILDLYSSTWNIIKKDIVGFSFNDHLTKGCIKKVFQNKNYILDPHSAVGYLALEQYLMTHSNSNGIVLGTAHPSKFIDSIESVISHKIQIPSRLSALKNKQKVNTLIENKFNTFKTYLIETLN